MPHCYEIQRPKELIDVNVRPITLIAQCLWENFCHMLSNKLSKWFKFHSRRAVFCDLFSMHLTMKTQIFEQAQSQLGYLRRNNNIFTNNETRA